MLKRPLARLLAVTIALGVVVLAGQASFSASSASSATYTVRSGDTLWAIARTNGVTMQQLAAANGMRLTDLLLIGRHLVIPAKAGTVKSVASVTAAPAPGATSGAATATAVLAERTFCSVFQPAWSPYGQLPSALTAQPSRLALRPIMVEWATHYGISPALVEAIAWQESGWQEPVVSSASAVGVGQLLPATAQFVSTQLIGVPLDINVAADNIRMTARFLAYLSAETGGSRCATIAAYYEGMGLLTKYGVIPETQAYVASVEALIPRFE